TAIKSVVTRKQEWLFHSVGNYQRVIDRSKIRQNGVGRQYPETKIERVIFRIRSNYLNPVCGKFPLSDIIIYRPFGDDAFMFLRRISGDKCDADHIRAWI